MAAAQAAVDACAALREKDFSVTAIQDRYHLNKCSIGL
jgi:hypothetical protein